mmetsp:Transcript_126922/g.320636  ORF Transcript_126922/g.320636 Transcript_126922/m.320636 type:complete len:259 (+) Transcript_126922:108-884(+)
MDDVRRDRVHLHDVIFSRVPPPRLSSWLGWAERALRRHRLHGPRVFCLHHPAVVLAVEGGEPRGRVLRARHWVRIPAGLLVLSHREVDLRRPPGLPPRVRLPRRLGVRGVAVRLRLRGGSAREPGGQRGHAGVDDDRFADGVGLGLRQGLAGPEHALRADPPRTAADRRVGPRLRPQRRHRPRTSLRQPLDVVPRSARTPRASGSLIAYHRWPLGGHRLRFDFGGADGSGKHREGSRRTHRVDLDPAPSRRRHRALRF